MQIKLQIVLLLSLCAYAKKPKASKSATEVESGSTSSAEITAGDASLTETHVDQTVLYTHACESNYMVYSTTGPLGSKGLFEQLADIMCRTYDFALYKHIDIYKEFRKKSKECEDATAKRDNESINLRLLMNQMEPHDDDKQPKSTMRNLKSSLAKAEKNHKKAVEQQKRVCSDYEEFEKEVSSFLKDFEKEAKVVSDKTDRYLQACMNDADSCEEERKSMEIWIEKIRADAKKEEEEERKKKEQQKEMRRQLGWMARVRRSSVGRFFTNTFNLLRKLLRRN
ncbi:hypothetical protein BASA61_000968 [Batrachochytrium salamandrivorans]|nr:hypothetical protein BASA61_000968 [Batrachochytrium salamandrivorans]